MYNKVKTDTWRTAHFGQFCLPKEYNFNEMKKSNRFAVLYIKSVYCLFSILTL